MKGRLTLLGLGALALILLFSLGSCDVFGQERVEESSSTSGPRPIRELNLDIPAPALGVPPVWIATTSGEVDFIPGVLAWTPVHNPYRGETVYSVRVTLTAKDGFTFTGLNNPRINGRAATATNNNGRTVNLTYTFPQTLDKEITSLSLVSPPEKTEYTHGELLDLTGLQVRVHFDDTTSVVVAYTGFEELGLTVIPAHHTPLIRTQQGAFVHHNTRIVVRAGGVPDLDSGQLLLLVDTIPITQGNISVVHPVRGQVPDTTAAISSGANFSITSMSWSPTDSTFFGGVPYRAVLVLEAAENHGFTLEESKMTINGQAATISNIHHQGGRSAEISLSFSPIKGDEVDHLVIVSPPTKSLSSYVHDETLDLAGLVIRVVYEGLPDEEVPYHQFFDRGISSQPAHGEMIVKSHEGNLVHDGSLLVINRGGKTIDLGTLLVDKAPGEFVPLGQLPDFTYNGSPLDTIDLPLDYKFDNPNHIQNVGDDQSISIWYTHPSDNYYPVQGQVILTVKPGTRDFPTHPPLIATYSPTLTLNDLHLTPGYTWNYPNTELNAGFNQTAPATLTDPAGNWLPVGGHVTYTVAQADLPGGFPSIPAFDRTIYNGLSLSHLILPPGYEWVSPGHTLLPDTDGSYLYDAVYTHPSGNYLEIQGPVTITLSEPVFPPHPEVIGVYEPGLKLKNLTLNTHYSWDDDDLEEPLVAGTRVFTASYYDPDDLYDKVEGTITVNIAQADPVVTWPAGYTGIFGQTLSQVLGPETPGDSDVDGDFTWDNPAAPVGNAGERPHTMRFTPDDVNYKELTWSVIVEVDRAPGPAVDPPPSRHPSLEGGDSWMNFSNTIRIVPLENVPPQGVEYGISLTDDHNTVTEWLATTWFRDLEADTWYYIFARSQGNNNFWAGPPSASLAIKTDP
ncbi:MAG: hypothetical protein FWH12_07470 [Treponema sp.]|nr:hypothetical protein [Treponema sp.]